MAGKPKPTSRDEAPQDATLALLDQWERKDAKADAKTIERWEEEWEQFTRELDAEREREGALRRLFR